MTDRGGYFMQRRQISHLLILILVLGLGGVLLHSNGKDAVSIGAEKKDSILTAEQISVSFQQVGGRVVSVSAREGQFVRQGAVLMQLDTRDIELQIEKLIIQMLGMDVQIEQAKASLGNQDVNRQQYAVQLAQENLENAQNYCQRMEALYNAGACSLAMLEEAQLKVSSAENAVKQNQEMLIKYQSGLDAARLNATIPKEFDILNKCKRVPIPEGSNLLSNETILFREQIKEMFLSRCEAQQFAQDISLWSHVSLTAALASCYRSNPKKEIYLAVIGYPSISEWFFNVQQDKALKQICGRMALVLEQMYSCLGSVLEPNNLPIDCLLTRWNTGLVVIFPAEIKEIASEMLKRHSKTFGFAATMEHIRYAEDKNGYATLSLKDALAKAYSRWLKGPRDIAWAPDDKPGFYSKTCIYCEQDPCICAEAEKLGAFPWKYSFETNSLDSQGFDLNIPYYHFLPLRTMFCDIKIHGMDNFFSQENNFLTAGRTFEILKRIETYLFTLSKDFFYPTIRIVA
jgi:hypothetical protein